MAADVNHLDLGREARRLRVDTLSRLRWLAIAGQTTAIVVTRFVLGFPLEIGFCFVAVAVSVWLNVGLRLRYPVTHRLGDGAAFALLTFDVLQLSGLLYLTGGLENPFALLFLAPIMASAVSLPPKWTSRLALVTIGATSLLAFFHLPLPWRPGEPFTLPIAYVAGIWTALVLGAGFIAVYASRVAAEARQLSDALAATELVLAREQHLIQLDGLAAAAAHELGTPLGTIALVAKELNRSLEADDAKAPDIQLIWQEVQRCRTILSRLTSLGREGDSLLDAMKIGHMIEEVAAPRRGRGPLVQVDRAGEGPEPVGARNPGILYGLGNIIDNAVDFALSAVRVAAEWSRDKVEITVSDDGPGFSPEVVGRIGEPYVSTRSAADLAAPENHGLGLGLFIAKSLLERSNAIVTVGNAIPPETGARVRISWSRAAFERGLAGGDEVRAI